jgi:hypothetical protein
MQANVNIAGMGTPTHQSAAMTPEPAVAPQARAPLPFQLFFFWGGKGFMANNCMQKIKLSIYSFFLSLWIQTSQQPISQITWLKGLPSVYY